MSKFFSFLIFASLFSLGLSAQNPPTQVAGLYDALQFAYGVGNVPGLKVAIGNPATGASRITLNYGFFTLQGGIKIYPLATNAPLTVGSGASLETVTPTSVSCTQPTVPNSCSFTASFTKVHGIGENVSSGTIGLNEAINYVHGIGGSVMVSGAWVSAGGTTTIFNAAPSFSNVVALDNRTGLVVGGGGGGNVTQAGTNQVFTGANGLEVGAGGVLSLPLNVSSALTTPLTPGGPSGTYGQGHFNWQFSNESFTNTLGTAIDTEMGLGYNICLHGTSCIGTEPAWFYGLENNYLGGGSSWVNEAYIQFQPTPNGASRPWFVQVDRSSGCITSGLCLLTDWEINSPPNVGVGFHDWSNNAVEWATINGNGLQMAGYATQPSDTYLNIIGQNGKFGEFAFTNGTTGYKGYSVSDSSTIWEFDLLGTNNWMQYNNNKTSLGGSAAYNGNATLTVQAGSGTNPVMSLGLNTSNTANLLNFYGNTGTLLGNVNDVGGLTMPTITDSGLTSGQCVQAGTGGLLTSTGSACGSGGGGGITALTGDVTASGSGSVAATLATVNSNVGSFTAANITVNAKGLITAASNGSGGGGNTTSTSLVSGQLPVANGANSIINSGLAAGSSDISPTSNVALTFGAEASNTQTVGTQFWCYNGTTQVECAVINSHGNATFGAAADSAGTGSAVFATGAVTSSGNYHFNSKSWISSPADSQIEFTNNATTGFNYLFFGGSTSSFPALHVNGAALEAYKGTSGYGQFNAAAFDIEGAFTTATLNSTYACTGGTNYGLLSWVTDALSPASFTTITGGGSVIMPAYCDGVSWKSIGGVSGGSGITALTGIVSASGSGSVATTLALGSSGALQTTGAQLDINAAVVPTLPASNTFTAANTFSAAGAASAPGLSVTGAPFLGTGTTSTPQLFVNCAGSTQPSTWSTLGTFIGINSCPSYTGNLLDFHGNGGASLFSASSSGNVTAAGTINAPRYATSTNCSSTASPAVCGAAVAGVVQIAAAGTSIVVNTSAVTANSRIQLTFSDNGITAPTNMGSLLPPYVSAITAGTSFTVTVGVAPVANPVNVFYFIID